MKTVIYVMLALLAFSLPALGQSDVEFSGGYQHISGDQGLDGYRVGVGWSPIPNFQLALNYDGVYDNSTIGSFELTSVGSTFSNSHLQDVIVGPRYFLPGVLHGHGKVQGHLLIPFVETQFGEARLHSRLRSNVIGDVQAADTAFVWTLGGGVDYRIYSHWAVRTNIGFMRTHFANSGQGRVNLGIGVVWSARSRSTW
jgi:opacity protein-like surface antigen